MSLIGRLLVGLGFLDGLRHPFLGSIIPFGVVLLGKCLQLGGGTDEFIPAPQMRV